MVIFILPSLLLSILPSVFLDRFGNVETRDKIGRKLGLGSLSYNEDGEEFISACENGYAALVEIILKSTKISTLNRKSRNGYTGLHIACFLNRIKAVELLVQQPTINLNVQDYEDFTPLHRACMENNTDVVKILIKQKIVDLNIKDNDGYTAFFYACDKSKEMIETMLGTGKIQVEELKGFTDFVKNEDGSKKFLIITENGKKLFITLDATNNLKSIELSV